MSGTTSTQIENSTLQKSNGYGRFSEDGREYIITRPDTPRPWFNYLFNHLYHALVSHTGGGFSYYDDPKSNRISRWDHLSTDRPGRYVFIRDQVTGEVWAPNWQPFRKDLDFWECRVRPGSSVIKAEQDGIAAQITYSVALEDPVENWLIKIKNNRSEKASLRVFPFVEWICGDAELEANYRNILCLYNRADYDEKLKAIVAYKQVFRAKQPSWQMHMASSLPISGYDCNKEAFLGRYNDIQDPDAILIRGECNNTYSDGEDMIGVLQSDIELGPGEEKEFVVSIGFTEERSGISQLTKTWLSVDRVKKELKAIEAHWDEVINRFKVETPDPNFNLMTNIWGKYQLCAIMHSRGTSAYHGTEGGIGYRDTCQDAEGLFAVHMPTAMNKLERLLFWQYSNGHAVSGFSSSEGSWDSIEGAIVSGKSDVAVWLPYTVVSYIKETGDLDFLKKQYDFHDGGKATVYEHILRSVRYIYDQRGERQLPYIRKADWNDAYDHVGIGGKGESVWLGMALARAARQIKALAEFIGDQPVAKEMQAIYDDMKAIINKVAWDGKWYVAAFNDAGMKIGSNENKEGKVPLNSQTWSILSGVVPEDRLESVLDQIDNYLDSDYGPVLFWPSYSEFNPGIGRVTSFADGTKENAAVFSHACAFKVVADCELKRADKAYETFSKVMPMNPKKADPDHYKVEPYVFAEFTVGPGSRNRFGEGSFMWNTGTTPWMFTAATEWILGVRREFDGLLVDPCIPKKWPKAWVRRPFRGDVYEVSILNPKGVSHGVAKVVVDGKEQKSPLIKPFGDGKVHQVEVTLG
ncbi:MAG: hypothetical protein JW937_10650 [Candidatus Omnitrophica bacterium]|nr:hypothetical protein [Candidatus Omnitrophota bacterium]